MNKNCIKNKFDLFDILLTIYKNTSNNCVIQWRRKDDSIECIDGKEFIPTVRQWSGTHEWTDSQSTDHCIHFLVYTTT